MSLLAETLIDEWLNRQRFLTMRGIKNSGVDEIDLLGVRKEGTEIEGWHVEAQISFRPVGYISKLTQAHSKQHSKARTSALKRPPELLKECVAEFVRHKFDSEKKRNARKIVWPGINWKNVFIHGKVRDESELNLISAAGVKVISFHDVLTYLAKKSPVTGAAGTDISEIVEYFAKSSGTTSG